MFFKCSCSVLLVMYDEWNALIKGYTVLRMCLGLLLYTFTIHAITKGIPLSDINSKYVASYCKKKLVNSIACLTSYSGFIH